MPKLSNLPYESIVNPYLDDDTVTPEEILPDKKLIKYYRSDIEVESGLTRATREAHEREREITDGESHFFFDQVPAGQFHSRNELSNSNWPKRYTANGAQRKT